jgi:hypothetical protein
MLLLTASCDPDRWVGSPMKTFVHPDFEATWDQTQTAFARHREQLIRNSPNREEKMMKLDRIQTSIEEALSVSGEVNDETGNETSGNGESCNVIADEVEDTKNEKQKRLDPRYWGQIDVLQKYTELVHAAVRPTAACWESSLMLRDLLICHGFRSSKPKVVTVTVHGCDEHCVVLCGGYICDPTAFQFGKCDAWVIVHKDDPQSVYALGGSPGTD